MKHIFEPSDIKSGMFIKCKNVVSIISWDSGDDAEGKFGNSDRIIYLTQINSDGMMIRLGKTFVEAAEHLTKYSYLQIDNPLKEPYWYITKEKA